jgi:hypothetical protein
MENSITQLLIVALAIVPFCNGIVQVVKTSINIPKNFIPLVSIVSGVVVGGIFTLITKDYTLTQLLIAGGVAGMASCGVYDIVVPNKAIENKETK